MLQRKDKFGLVQGLPRVVALVALMMMLPDGLRAAVVRATDGVQDIVELPLGADLLVGGFGLPASSELHIVLASPAGEVLAAARRTSDEVGRLEPRRLWYRTGIGGCDCRPPDQEYPYRYPAEARQLLGQVLEVHIYRPGVRNALASLVLPLVDFAAPLIFTADSTGCPSWRLSVMETLLLVSHAPVQQSATVFVVKHAEAWQAGDFFHDVRVAYPDGQVIVGGGGTWSEVLWQGVETEVGVYDLVIRWHGLNGVDLEPHLRSADQILSLPEGTFRGYSPAGLSIDEWVCVN